MSESFKLNGVDEIAKLFEQLPGVVGKRVVLAGLRSGGRVIKNGMKKRVRVRTGDLKKSIVVRTVKAKHRTKDKLVIVAFKKHESRRAHLEEYGTSKQDAAPFIRPTISADGQEAINAITTGFAENMEKAAVKLASDTGASRKK